jgi:hypothetical protein
MLHTITNRLWSLTVCLIASAGLTGCAGLSVSPSGAQPAGARTQIRAGNNVPTGYVINFQLPLSSVTLTSDKGTKVSLLPGAVTVEQAHLVGVEDVLTDLTIPEGTYTQADIVMQDAQLSYADLYSQVVETSLPAPASVHLTLNPPVTIGGSSTVIAVSLDLAQTLSIDATQDTASFNPPVFTITQETIAPPAAAVQSQTTAALPRDKAGPAGALGNVFGTVQSVSGSSFKLQNAATGASLTMYVDQGTVFQGVTLGTMKGLSIEAEVVTQTDGTLLAKEVELLGSGSGAAVLGVATSVAGMSVGTSVQAGLGSGVTSDVRGKTVMVDVSNAVYKLDTAGVDMTDIKYTFDRATFAPGQNVDLTSSYALQPDDNGSAGLLQADMVELEQQTISGTVASLGTDSSGRTTFNLMLPKDGSSLLTLLGPVENEVYVVVPSSAIVSGKLANDQQVNVHGLLFHNIRQAGSMARAHAAGPGQVASFEMVATAIQ